MPNTNTPPTNWLARFFWNLRNRDQKRKPWTDATAPVIVKGDKIEDPNIIDMNA